MIKKFCDICKKEIIGEHKEIKIYDSKILSLETFLHVHNKCLNKVFK
jgi:hypothetical protein